MKKLLAFTMALSLSLFAVACGDGGRGAADIAIKAAESAFAAAKVEAVKYVPDQVPGVEDALASVKANFDKGNFTQALTDAQGLMPKVTALKDAAAAQQSELTNTWASLSTGLPSVVLAIQSRVDILSKSKKLPAGLTKETFEGAKSGLDTMTKTWTEATDGFKSGNLVDAVAKAQSVKTQAASVMTALGMQVPDALK